MASIKYNALLVDISSPFTSMQRIINMHILNRILPELHIEDVLLTTGFYHAPIDQEIAQELDQTGNTHSYPLSNLTESDKERLRDPQLKQAYLLKDIFKQTARENQLPSGTVITHGYVLYLEKENRLQMYLPVACMDTDNHSNEELLAIAYAAINVLYKYSISKEDTLIFTVLPNQPYDTITSKSMDSLKN